MNTKTKLEKIHHFIDGKRVSGASGRFGDVYNPAIGAVAKQVPLASKAEVETAIAAALAAFSGWSATPVGQRARVMFAFRDLIRQNIDELARLLSAEHGKTIDDAKGSITRGLEVVEYACGIAQLLKGEYSESVAGGVDCWSVRQPLGVCAGITPFNFSGDGADVDVPDGDRVRQHVRAQTFRARPVLPAVSGRVDAASRSAGRRAECSQRRQRSGRYPADG